MYANGPSRLAGPQPARKRLGGTLQWSFPGFRLHSIQYGDFRTTQLTTVVLPYLLFRKYVKQLWKICTSSPDPQQLLKNIVVSDLSYHKLFALLTNLKRQTEKLLESVPKAVN